MSGRRAIAALAMVTCVALVAAGVRSGCRREPRIESSAGFGAYAWSEELPLTRVLLLFFPDARSGELRAEARRFIVEGGTSGLMKSALAELGRRPSDGGLVSPFEEGLSVRGIYSQEDGTLFVDLVAGARSVFGTGLSEETAAIGSIANTLFYNFPQVTRLRLLVDGEPISSLGGHIDLSGFIYPEEWLQASEVEL